MFTSRKSSADTKQTGSSSATSSGYDSPKHIHPSPSPPPQLETTAAYQGNMSPHHIQPPSPHVEDITAQFTTTPTRNMQASPSFSQAPIGVRSPVYEWESEEEFDPDDWVTEKEYNELQKQKEKEKRRSASTQGSNSDSMASPVSPLKHTQDSKVASASPMTSPLSPPPVTRIQTQDVHKQDSANSSMDSNEKLQAKHIEDGFKKLLNISDKPQPQMNGVQIQNSPIKNSPERVVGFGAGEVKPLPPLGRSQRLKMLYAQIQ